MRILQISPRDIGGGAERVAWNLFREYRERGHESFLAVGQKRSDDPGVLPIPKDTHPWAKAWTGAAQSLREQSLRGTWQVSRAMDAIGEPRHAITRWRGMEDFDYPSTQPDRLLGLPPSQADVLHAHNLHIRFFDLRSLAETSHRLPTFLTLHDMWLLTGHCAYSFDCPRWEIGCGACPDLSLYPAVERDATAENWRRKAAIYADSRLYISTPSQWLMDKVHASMLAAGCVEGRVIPYGVDLSIFRPATRSEARAQLGLPQEALILLSSGAGVRQNPYKDFETMRAGVEEAARRLGAFDVPLIFLMLGESGEPEQLSDSAQVRFMPFETDLSRIALFYQAADIYLHAARADNFPNAVLEALACGTPVIGSAVGGIPEQVTSPEREAPTGLLVPVGDVSGMAGAIQTLVESPELRQVYSENAARDAQVRFDLERQIQDHLTWYAEALERKSSYGELS
jgi:glycosyltransferase involved in cell wall biosynthesis